MFAALPACCADKLLFSTILTCTELAKVEQHSTDKETAARVAKVAIAAEQHSRQLAESDLESALGRLADSEAALQHSRNDAVAKGGVDAGEAALIAQAKLDAEKQADLLSALRAKLSSAAKQQKETAKLGRNLASAQVYISMTAVEVAATRHAHSASECPIF